MVIPEEVVACEGSRHCVCGTDTPDKISKPIRVLPGSEHCVTLVACSLSMFVVCLQLGEMKQQKSGLLILTTKGLRSYLLKGSYVYHLVDWVRVAWCTYRLLQLCIDFSCQPVLYVKPCNGCCFCMRQGPCFSSFLQFFPHSGMGVPPYG